MIDTLKLSKRLREAQMPQAQAEALAEGLAESLREGYVTREDLETQLARLRGALTGRIVGVAGLGVVLNHVWK